MDATDAAWLSRALAWLLASPVPKAFQWSHGLHSHHLGSSPGVPISPGCGALWTGKGLASSALWPFPAVAQGNPTGHSVLGRPLGDTGVQSHCCGLTSTLGAATAAMPQRNGPSEATCCPVFTGVRGPSAKPSPTEQDTFFPWSSHGCNLLPALPQNGMRRLCYTRPSALLVLTLSSLNTDALSQARCRGPRAQVQVRGRTEGKSNTSRVQMHHGGRGGCLRWGWKKAGLCPSSYWSA